jgi:hypothetical protein
MVEAAEASRQFCHYWAPARREGLRGEGACCRSMEMARAALAGPSGCSGSASEVCRKRLAQMKLSANCGPRGSRPRRCWHCGARACESTVLVTRGRRKGLRIKVVDTHTKGRLVQPPFADF